MNPAYRLGRMLAKEAFLPALGAAYDTLRQLPMSYERSYAMRAGGVDPAVFPALAYTQPAVAAGSSDPYATFALGGGGGGAPTHHRRHHH